ncbi:CDP-diacylglycerol--glycerol-3-phosphate 3-phosphatidyltransferase [Methylacidiphilum caldifontis]|nr:CDP-diacylglycerol--glycerol-3-phosphate 3-phosphatidyltransferase [Methylacidiphilum caldifontis]
MSQHAGRLNLPNQLSLARIGMCGLFVADLSIDWPFQATTALIIFLLASITDLLDGWIARNYNLVSELGKLLDPLADKILISAALLSLLQFNYAPLWAVITMIAREFLITGLRTLLAIHGKVMGADLGGKQKTVSQMIFIIGCFVSLSLKEIKLKTGFFEYFLENALFPMMLLTVVITVVSGTNYFYHNWELIHKEPEKKCE